jgi:hypothetical protein
MRSGMATSRRSSRTFQSNTDPWFTSLKIVTKVAAIILKYFTSIHKNTTKQNTNTSTLQPNSYLADIKIKTQHAL